MAVRCIVTNIAAADALAAHAFYGGLLGLEVGMDLGWVVTFAGSVPAAPQLSVVREGDGGAPVPDLSVEVDDAHELHRRGTRRGARGASSCAILSDGWSTS